MALDIFVPGRVCLFGEHSDWAAGYRRVNSEIEKGYTIITGTNHGIYARVDKHPGKLVIKATLPDGKVVGPHEISMERDALLREAEQGGFYSYAAGVAYQILLHYKVRGLVIDNYKMDLPLKKGLSSSAAFCVLTARAFNRLYDLKMTVRGEMEYAYLGEITTPSRCGRMDQGCAFGGRPILMSYDRDWVGVKELRATGELYLAIVDLHAQKDTKEILARLNRCYPFAETDIDRGVHYCLGESNKEIVQQAVEAIENGDAESVGRLMVEAQSRFDKYCAPACPQELTSPVLHKVLNYPPIQKHIWGGKGVGSQGDGTAQLLAKSKEDRSEVIRIIETDLGMTCLELDIVPGKKVRKAVIPAAGFGTQMYPASKAVKKELFPIVMADGMAKPIVLIIIEEALRAGIDEVCLIVQKGDETVFDDFLNGRVQPLHFHKLSQQAKEYTAYLTEVGSRVTFIAQESQEGLGHAVLCAREWVGDEPFLLMLGDHLYKSETEPCCARQVIDVYQNHQTPVVGLKRTREEDVSHFGTVAGRWTEDDSVLSITDFAEKPGIEYAREHLRVDGLNDNEYLTIFGQYVLTPRIFEILDEIVANNLRDQGEFQLTPALETLQQEEGFIGCMSRGTRFDIGDPRGYLEAIHAFAGDHDRPVGNPDSTEFS
ncbi:MAG: GHMP kinase [Candidatus Hydrogenedentes bacterium]|nr:GHMP kinase [Candidatus Hydrogenedentota bacterium]